MTTENNTDKTEIKKIVLPDAEPGTGCGCVVFGSGEKPLVILPGIGFSPVTEQASAVAEAYAPLCRDFRFYLIAHRDPVPDDYSVSMTAEDAAEAMRTLGISGACVLGVSQGGMAAQLLAARYPELVSRLILGSTLPGQNDVSREAFGSWAKLAQDGDAEALCADFSERVYPGGRFGAAFSELAKTLSSEQLRRFAALARSCGSYDGRAELGRIRCPVLILGAEDDRVVSAEGSKELARILKGSRLYIYGGAGHAVYDEAPDYRERIRSFFCEGKEIGQEYE